MTQQPKRILIVTPGASIFTGPFLRTFQSLGFDCEYFNHRQGAVFTSPRIRRAMHALPVLKIFKRIQVWYTNKKILAVVKRFQPQYLIGQKAENITPETIAKIKAAGVTTVNFYNDFINQWETIHRIAPAYDFFLTPDHYVLNKLREEGLKNCHYLPFAVEAPEPTPSFAGHVEKYPIGFVGTHNPAIYHNREKYLEAVKDLGLHIWGNEAWGQSSLRECFHGRASGDSRFDVYRSSKIVIDVNFNEWPCDAMSMRPTEVGYGGACLFSDTIRADLSRTFEPGKKFIAFSNPEELREKVIYYLEHDVERRAVALALHEDVLKNHTYQAWAAKILALVGRPLKDGVS